MLRIVSNTFISGIDKWHLENMVDFDFFWHSHPFENSKCKGFILPDVKLKKGIGMPVIIDVAEVKNIDVTLIDIENAVFYSEYWSTLSAIYATVAKNVITFYENVPMVIKENYKMI